MLFRSFLLQLVEGGTDGGSADVKALGEISLDDPGSGRELAVDDEFAKLVEGGTDAGAVDQFRWAGLRVIFGSGSGHRRDFRFWFQLILDCTITNCGAAMLESI